MDDFRADVRALMEVKEEEEEMTQEQFNQMMDNYLAQLSELEPSAWSKEARDYCEKNGIINGNEKGFKMYKSFLTREQMAQIVYNMSKLN